MNGNDDNSSNSPSHNVHHNNSSNSNLTRTTIREANIHLQLLHNHNQELERICETQSQTIQRQAEALIKKDKEYVDLYKTVKLLESDCSKLQMMLQEKDKRLNISDRKNCIFRETLELKPAIQQLLDVLNTFDEEDHTNSVNNSASSIGKGISFVGLQNHQHHNGGHKRYRIQADLLPTKNDLSSADHDQQHQTNDTTSINLDN